MKHDRADTQLWLQSLTLERFKAAFKPPVISLRPFTVVIGRNGSGKSTLLEALQWLDTTLRQDARTASNRYRGVHDLINVRSQKQPKYFRIKLTWTRGDDDRTALDYEVKVFEGSDRATPLIGAERLHFKPEGGKQQRLIQTSKEGDPKRMRPGERTLYADDPSRQRQFDDPDRLALGAASRIQSKERAGDPVGDLVEFWRRAVFLRLSPNRLAMDSPAKRKSFDPLLDEEGHMLPALLTELNKEQRAALVEEIQKVLPDITDVQVSKPRASRDEPVHYSLTEVMPYQGQKGKGRFTIPAWMLSEGTRRITAIFALLTRDPPPSLLCIEEIENGLDPWTVIHMLKALRSASDRGTQVLVTTHSPWLLDQVALDDVLQVKRVAGETKYEPFRDRDDVMRFSAGIPPGARYVNETE